jgi:hypothetical protein
MTWQLAGINTLGILTTHATIGRPKGGDHEYLLWAIGHGWLK